MKKSLFVLILLVLILAGCQAKSTNNSHEKQDLTKIRIGWQIPWATEGQLTQILKHTDVLKDNELEGDFKGFSYGGPLNEAAIAGEVDVIFTADQPAAMLLAKDSNWVIIGRLMYNRVSLYVPPASPIKNISDLKGKTVAMPFGAAAQRMALAAEIEAGLDPKKDVNNVNLGIYEQSDLVRDSGVERWGTIDALAGFDPTPAIFEEKGLVRNLKVGKIVSVIVMNKDFITANPGAPVSFLKSFKAAYEYYQDNIEQANTWFTEEAGLDITPGALKIAADIEPNLESGNEIRIDFTAEDYEIMQSAADFLHDQELIKEKVEMKNYIDLNYLKGI